MFGISTDDDLHYERKNFLFSGYQKDTSQVDKKDWQIENDRRESYCFCSHLKMIFKKKSFKYHTKNKERHIGLDIAFKNLGCARFADYIYI